MPDALAEADGRSGVGLPRPGAGEAAEGSSERAGVGVADGPGVGLVHAARTHRPAQASADTRVLMVLRV